MKEFEIHYLSTEGPGLFGGLGIGNDQNEAVAYFLDAHGSECKKKWRERPSIYTACIFCKDGTQSKHFYFLLSRLKNYLR